MARFKWTALTPGIAWAVGKNPDGSIRTHTFTEADSRRFATSGAEMLAAGINIPIALEHRDDQRPRRMSKDDWASERAKSTLGWVDKFFVNKKTKQLIIEGEAPHEEDAKKIEAIRFCSPEIDAFQDGTAKDWGEVITHLAVTPKPVQHDQTPVLRLGHEGLMRLAVNPFKGGEMDNEDGEKKKKKDGDASDAEGDAPPPEPSGASDYESDDDDDALDSPMVKDYFQPVIQLLAAKKDLKLPKDTTPENAWERLYVLLFNHEEQQPETGLNPNDLEEVSPGQGGAQGASTPMMLSLESQNAALREKLVGIERKRLERRLDWLQRNGLATTTEVIVKKKELTATRMSLTATHDVEPSSVAAFVASREVMPKNSVFSLNGSGGKGSRLGREVPPPPEAYARGADLTDEQKAELKADAKKLVHG